jgi:hypothetical protein
MHIKHFCALALGLAAITAQASDRTVMMPIAAAMSSPDAQAKLGNNIKYYFGDQKVPGKLTKLGSSKTSQKSNAFAKSDENVCNWVFLSAMLRLQQHAEKIGANAVVNIRSNYNNQEHSSSTEFECHAGAIMAGVALTADFVKVAE